MVKQSETKIHQDYKKRKARERNLDPPPKENPQAIRKKQTKNTGKKKKKRVSERKNKQYNNLKGIF